MWVNQGVLLVSGRISSYFYNIMSNSKEIKEKRSSIFVFKEVLLEGDYALPML